MPKYGASFSVPYANYLGLKPKECLKDALTDLGVRRLRLMSYWNQIEINRGKYNFTELDWQIKMANEAGAEVTLCLGLRQPRWPENHWPDWAKNLPEDEWQTELLNYIEAVVRRYRRSRCVISYQLENEALLKNFGKNGNFDRNRLKREFRFVKSLDPSRPVIMTTSNSWGYPLLGPRPDIYGFSIYRFFYRDKKYRQTYQRPWMFKLRAFIIKITQRRESFIHELQAEPWGPVGIPDMSIEEQYNSVNPLSVQEAIKFANSTGLSPIDIWGVEWWYWLKIKHNKPEIWDYMSKIFQGSA